MSFTLNLRLFFTPLFGDYTIIGRFIGFIYRVVSIIMGLVFMVILTIASVLTPLIWWLLPIVGFLETKGLVVLVLFGLYFYWSAKTANTPDKKVTEVPVEECLKTFRPKTKEFWDLASNDLRKGLQALTKDPQIIHLLKKSELLTNEFTDKLKEAPTFDTNSLDKAAYNFAKDAKCRYVEVEHLFVVIMKAIPKIDVLLATFGSRVEILEKTAIWIVSDRERLAKLYIWQSDYENIFTGGTGKGRTGRVTPFLDSMSEDFTKKAIQGNYERYTVRGNTIKRVAELLGGSNENLLIVGEPGSGKTSIVKGIAYKVMEGTKYKSLWNKRIVSIDLAGIVTGTKTPGEIADKLKAAFTDAKGSGDIILFIDEIHTLVSGDGTGASGISVVFSILEPQLSAGDIQFIGATNIQNYRRYIEPNGSFARLFKMIEIDEASKEETLEILKYDVRDIEAKKNIFVTYPALEKIIDLSKKLIHERVLPDKAIKVLDMATTSVAEGTKYIDSQIVAREISEITHIPASIITEEEATKLLRIEEEIKQMVIGQDQATKQVAAALKRARAGMRDENKPIASFLFVGTTGVGKTQTAKALAKTYFGDAKNMIRLDMSEYQQIDSMSRLLGTPDGSTKGILTESIRTKPFSLILLDEIEKAHPNILLTFLQVLDDGRLTDSSGTLVDFTNSIIIATSNVGTKAIQQIFERAGSTDEMRETAMKEVREHFAPEFLNRFTGVIVFNPLTIDNVRKITELLLNNVKKTADTKGIKVDIKPEVIDELMKRGYNPQWGARPMARVIEDTVESYLAEKILTKEAKQGDELSLGMEVFSI